VRWALSDANRISYRTFPAHVASYDLLIVAWAEDELSERWPRSTTREEFTSYVHASYTALRQQQTRLIGTVNGAAPRSATRVRA
jgi:hypothetical protein